MSIKLAEALKIATIMVIGEETCRVINIDPEQLTVHSEETCAIIQNEDSLEESELTFSEIVDKVEENKLQILSLHIVPFSL